MSQQEPNHKRLDEIVTELVRLRTALKKMTELDIGLRNEFAELVEYAEDATKSQSVWVGQNTVALSRSISRKVDEKALAELIKQYPGIERAFKPTNKVIANRLKAAGPKYGPLIESVLTDKPGSLALKITERKEDE